MPRRTALILGVLAFVAFLALTPSALAATLYVSESGGNANGCPQVEPCSIGNAVQQAIDKDTVFVAPGTYFAPFVMETITISGEVGKAHPVFKVPGGGPPFDMVFGGSVRHLRIEAQAGVTGLFIGRDGGVVEDVESVGAASVACLTETIAPVSFRDAVCASSDPVGVGVLMSKTEAIGGGIVNNLTNVTAVGGEDGLAAVVEKGGALALVAKNLIASGGEADVSATGDGSFGASASVSLSSSNFATADTFSPATSITPPGSGPNQTAEPRFVDAPAGNYREAAGSPTIGAGDLSVLVPGEKAAGGEPRTVTCSNGTFVDIGAYQFPIACPASPLAPPALVPVGKAPALSGLSLKPNRFAVSGTPAPKGAPRRTTVNYTLGAAAEVKLEILAKAHRKGKKPRLVSRGQLNVKGKAGANRLSFNGKLKGKALAPGKYTLRAVATAGGLSSAAVAAPFEIFVAAPPRTAG
jgi:hypothetical protein